MANEMILVVDADKKSQKVLEVCFKKAGYRVELADTVAEAMQSIERTQPSLIISDTVLTDGDGLEFCADLKHDARYKDIPFVFLTEDRSLPQKMRGFELGADDYLTKPIYIKEVTTRVELLLQKRAKELLADADAEAFEGDLSDITMIDLLQSIESEGRSGSVSILRGTRQAVVYFRDGNLLDAICGKLQGEDAVYRVMTWPDGRFVVRYYEHLRRVDHIEKSTDALLLEGIHRLEAWSALAERMPGLERIFAVNYQQMSAHAEELPAEVEQVVRLFDGHRSLNDVVDDSPMEDILTLQIIHRLLEDRLLDDVTPLEAPSSGNTSLDPAGLNAWLASNELRDTNPGIPFRESEEEGDGDSESFEQAVERRAQEDADEVQTVDLRRPVEQSGEESGEEPGVGGGHWRFHWSDDEDSGLVESGLDDDDEERESSTSRLAGSAVSVTGWDEEDPGEDVADEVMDSLREVEARETIRREEEARRLAEQMRQIESNVAHTQLQSVPVSVEEPEVAEEPLSEDGGLQVDSTQELFVTSVQEATAEVEADEAYYERSRASTPLSTPAQLIRASAVSEVDGQWGALETAVASPVAESVGDEVSAPVVYAAREAVETLEPVLVADEAVVAEESPVEAAEAETAEHDVVEDRVEAAAEEVAQGEAGAEVATDAVVDAEAGQDEESERQVERREQAIDEADAVKQEVAEARAYRSERPTLPLFESEESEEVASEAAVEAEAAESEGAQGADEAAFATEERGLDEESAEVSLPQEEPTVPEEDEEPLQRVVSAFEAVEEFEAPLFDPVDPQTTSLQSPREGEVVRATFDLTKSGYRNVRQASKQKSEAGGGVEKSASVEESTEEVEEKSAEELAGSVAAEVDAEASEVAEASEAPENSEVSEASEDSEVSEASEDSEASTDVEAPQESKAEAAEEKIEKIEKEEEKVEASAGAGLAESAEEDSFFSREDSFEDYEEPRVVSSNWKGPVLIAGIVALLAVLAWSGFRLFDSGASKVDPAPAPVAEVVEKEEPVAEEPAPVAVEEPAESAVEEAVVEAEAAELAGEEAEAGEEGLAAEAVEEAVLGEEVGEVAAAAAEEEVVAQEPVQEVAVVEPVVEEKPVVEKPVVEKPVEKAASAVAAKSAGSSAAAAPAATTFEGKVLELREMIRRERTADALKLARELSAQAPTDRSVAFLHGQAAAYENLNKEALENLERAERLGMRTSALYMELGQAYQLAGQTARAKQAYEAFLELQPSGRSADEVRSILQNQF